MSALAKQTIKHWETIEPYVCMPRNEREYQEQINFLNELMDLASRDENPHVSSLLGVIARNVEAYERKKHLTKALAPREVLRYLMDEHGLKQSDLSEIGSQSLVSKILTGERNLTIEQIKSLARRFHVSPAVFC